MIAWLAMGLALLEFSLADDLPAERVQGAFQAAGAALLIAAVWKVPALLLLPTLAVAGGPLAFLLLHALLRRAFRRWKGEEPVLATQGARSGSGGRFFFEPGRVRSVVWKDYLYSFLLGVGLLAVLLPAIAEVAGPG